MQDPLLEVRSLADIHAAAGTGPRSVEVSVFGYLRQAPAVHKALTEGMQTCYWKVSNMEQVTAARDMELALAKMAGALADIGREGVVLEEMQAAAKTLEQAAQELLQQQILGTEDQIENLANPSLDLAQGAWTGHVDRLKLDEAANKVEEARDRRVRLEPNHAPLCLKSDRDIEEVSPTVHYQPGVVQVVVHPPEEVQPYDNDWTVSTDVVVIGVAPISCARAFSSRLEWSAFTRGWRVQGEEKLSKIVDLLTGLEGLSSNVKRVFDRNILPDNGVGTPAFQELLEELEREADEFNTLVFGMKKLLMGELAPVACASDLVKQVVYAGRAVPLDPDTVRGKTNEALQTIDHIKDSDIVFLERDEAVSEEAAEEDEGPWEECPW